MVLCVVLLDCVVILILESKFPLSVNETDAAGREHGRMKFRETLHSRSKRECGKTCLRLQPEWEQLAGAVQGQVTIAYWDTQQQQRPPRLLGDIQGTPTLRLYKPKKKQRKPDSNAEKVVVDYRHGERTAKDMKAFLENEMPNYSERITFGQKDLDKASQKADKYGLPVALLFTSKPKTSPLVKFLSTEFRRRLLLVEIPPTTNNQPLLQKYGMEHKDTLPALLVIPPNNGGDEATQQQQKQHRYYEGDKFTRRKLQDFLSKHALKEPVYKAREEIVVGDETKDDPSKTEF
ncbi:thioredoxin [Nitzschia inconspicua]|uniref:Thioredoxin n=1 Tax=Nitzschia inconspicua TaxID=303405 RepID=A0A9K3LVK8_9STRA|nr:thioredoxin [Nitzschia inconspicua]